MFLFIDMHCSLYYIKPFSYASATYILLVVFVHELTKIVHIHVSVATNNYYFDTVQ